MEPQLNGKVQKILTIDRPRLNSSYYILLSNI